MDPGGGGGVATNFFAHMGSIMGLIGIFHMIPRDVWRNLSFLLDKVLPWLQWDTTLSIPEFASNSPNEIYELVQHHVTSLTSAKNTANHIRLFQVKNSSKPNYSPESGEPIQEIFRGVKFHWVYVATETRGNQPGYYFDRSGGIERKFTLRVSKRYKYDLLPIFMEEVLKHGRDLRHTNTDRRIFTNSRPGGWDYKARPWRSVPFKHASTFATLAMDPTVKNSLLDDLDAFMNGEDFFNRVGRAWKRGYLLYGPPGTGKSSLIAAIANYTQFDVYDLELTEVDSNATLRKLLMGITNKSIIVIEDIDCSVEIKKRGEAAPPDDGSSKDGAEVASKERKKEEDKASRVTLSGLLNFIDGLWSCIGSERIIIFTTNFKDKLDPALLRSGRMDLHIHMSYIRFEAFKTLVWTHLGIREHELLQEIAGLIENADMTPADAAEMLIQNRIDPTAALQRVIQELKTCGRKSEDPPKQAEPGSSEGSKTQEQDGPVRTNVRKIS